MLFSTKALATAGLLLEVASAFPAAAKRQQGPTGICNVGSTGPATGYGSLANRLGTYVPPNATDSRGPCPMLNTLANHNLLPHDGRNINSSQILEAIPRGFGVNPDGFATALHNFEVVCEYIKGSSCVDKTTGFAMLTNLTILGEPFAFEHDHSYSRADYKEAYGGGAITDNLHFNSTEFQRSLDVVKYQPTNPPNRALLTFQDFQQIRLQRVADSYADDFPGFFELNVPTTLFETGFIFGATFDRDCQGNQIGENPMPRADWWNYWFSEEDFPTHLGWVPASTTHFDLNFITSVSAAILNATIISTPSPLPSGAIASSYAAAGSLPAQDPSPTFLLYQAPPYVAPTNPTGIKTENPSSPTPTLNFPQKRGADLHPSMSGKMAAEMTARPSLYHQAIKNAGKAPPKFDLYKQKVEVGALRNQIAMHQAYQDDVMNNMVMLMEN